MLSFGPIGFDAVAGAGSADAPATGALAVYQADHAHSVPEVVISSAAFLTAANGLHSHAADAPTLIPSLVVAATLHTSTVDELQLVPALVPAGALHTHLADVSYLVPKLIVADCLHTQPSQPIAGMLGQLGTLLGLGFWPASAANPILLQQYNLVLAEALHLHDVDALPLTQKSLLLLEDVLQGHVVDGLLLYSPWQTVQEEPGVHTLISNTDSQLVESTSERHRTVSSIIYPRVLK